MPSTICVVNFGTAKTGLSTIGYTVYNKDGTTNQARSTTGVSELIASSGIYYAEITHASDFQGEILWDTGDASKRYIGESVNPVDPSQAADETRTMLRSLNASLASQLSKLRNAKVPEQAKVDLSNIEEKLEKLSKKVTDVSSQVAQVEVSPMVNIDLGQINDSIKSLRMEIKERDSQLKSQMKFAQGTFDGRTKQAIESVKALSAQVLKASDIKDKNAQLQLSKRMREVHELLEKSVGQTVKDFQRQVDSLMERLNKKTKADELLETLTQSLADSKGKIESPKKGISETELNLILGLYR